MRKKKIKKGNLSRKYPHLILNTIYEICANLTAEYFIKFIPSSKTLCCGYFETKIIT